MQRNTKRKGKGWKNIVSAVAEGREETVKIGGGKLRI